MRYKGKVSTLPGIGPALVFVCIIMLILKNNDKLLDSKNDSERSAVNTICDYCLIKIMDIKTFIYSYLLAVNTCEFFSWFLKRTFFEKPYIKM